MRLAQHTHHLILVFALSFSAVAAEITQDDLGILHGDFAKVDKPISAVDLGPIQNVRNIWLTPDAKRALIHEWKTDDNKQKLDRLLIVDPATAKLERVLAEKPGRWIDQRSVQITPDSKSAITRNPKAIGLIQLSLDTGEITKTISFDRPYESLQFDSDATRAVAMTEDGGAVIFDLAAGKADYHKLNFLPEKSPAMLYPLAGRSELLVHYGIAEKEKNFIALFDPKTAKVRPITEFIGNATVLPTPDGKTAYVFRQENPGAVVWTSIETWDLQTLKQLVRQPLKPPMASVRLKLSADGQTLFFHEYLVQPVVVWNLKTGALAGVVAPADGGCGTFDITPDGKKLIATAGPWKQGTLIPRNLALYDTSKLLTQP